MSGAPTPPPGPRRRPAEPEATLAEGPGPLPPAPDATYVEPGPPAGAPDQTLDVDGADLPVAPPDRTLELEGPGGGDRTVVRSRRPAPSPDATLPVDGGAPATAPDATLALDGSSPAGPRPDRTIAMPGSLSGPADATGVWSDETPAPGSVAFSLASRAGSLHGAGEIERLPDVPAVPGYEILGELGRGAMGVVYKARQVGLKRLVALKMILTGGHASATELRRFRTEAEAVAALQHPNIVQVYEIGDHGGLPFFSLEFIDGGCLADKLAETSLPAREAARMVQQLASAMAYAHGRGIIHRDLKPANVLLTRDGVPKVTDFGLAKKIEEDSGATRAGAIMGTPSYMAPEQAEGRTPDIGPPADIYALGAILYDLLTGRPPFKGATILETLNQVRHIEPVPPARLTPQMPRDLETICLKCLHKDPVRRYVTAADLAADLGRFLAGEPIQARPVSTWERAWKWCRRRPAAAGLIAVSALSVVALAAGGLLYGRAQAERRQEAEDLRAAAEAEQRRAEGHFGDAREAVDQMLTRIGGERLAYEPRMEQVRRDLLDRAARFYEKFLQSEAPTAELQHQAALAYRQLGDIRAQLEQPEQAAAAYDRSAALLERLADAHPDELAYRQDLAATRINQGNLLRGAGRGAEAGVKFRQAAEGLAAAGRGREAPPAVRRSLARALYNLGLTEESAGRRDEAGGRFNEALGLQQALVKEGAPGADGGQELARTWVALGGLAGEKDLAAARKAYESAIALLDGAVRAAPGNPGPRQDLLAACERLGTLLRDPDPKQAEKLLARAVSLGEGLVGDFPTVPDYRQRLAFALSNQGVLFLAAGRRAEADRAFEQSLRLREQLAETFPRKPEYRRALAAGLNDHALLLQTADRPAEARRSLERAARAWADLAEAFPAVEDYQREHLGTLLNLATAEMALDLDGAERRLREVRRLAGTAAALAAERAQAASKLGALLIARGRPPEAEKLLNEAVAEGQQAAKARPNQPEPALHLGMALTNRGELHGRTKRPKEAEADWKEAARVLEEAAGRAPGSPTYPREQARALHNLGTLYMSLNRLSDAEAAYRAASALRQKLAEAYKGEPGYRYEQARSLGGLATAQGLLNRVALSGASFKGAIKLLQELEAKHPANPAYRAELITQHANYAQLLSALGQDDEALAQWRAELAQKEKLAQASPGDAALLSDLGRAYHLLATRLHPMNKHDEAVKALEEAISRQEGAVKLAPKNALYSATLTAHRFGLADAHLLRKGPAAAAKVIDDLVAAAPAGWPNYPAAAAVLARCAGLASGDEAKAYGDRAVAALRKAKEAGFKDAGALRKAREFDAIRERDDFKKLLAGMEKKE